MLFLNHISIPVPYSKEYSLEGTNETKLSELAKLTGGKKLKAPSEAFRIMKTQNFVHKDITPWILLFAFLLLFIELVIRRFGLVTIQNYFGNLRLGAKQRQNPQASTTDQLLKKQRKKKMKTQKPSSKNEKAMDKLDENKEKEISETFPTPNQETISSHNKNDLPSKKLMEKENQDISWEERLKRLIEAKKRKGR